jgi:NADH-quinone oxidoreductase subunit I
MVYEKQDLLISGPGKYHDYDFYKVAGVSLGGKGKGEGEADASPRDRFGLLP